MRDTIVHYNVVRQIEISNVGEENQYQCTAPKAPIVDSVARTSAQDENRCPLPFRFGRKTEMKNIPRQLTPCLLVLTDMEEGVPSAVQ